MRSFFGKEHCLDGKFFRSGPKEEKKEAPMNVKGKGKGPMNLFPTGEKGGRKSSGKEKRKSVLKRPTLIASPIDGPEMSRVRMRLLLRGLRLPNVSM